jgi:DNA (cytosine-5)-methyltransferase 1
MGLHRAGFDVTGVDIRPQPHYPFKFQQSDAMTFPLDGFDFIWASPPCQGYSIARNNGRAKPAPRLIPAVRSRLLSCGVPWIIENVCLAPLRFAFLLCGASFGLSIAGFDLCRHRIFESSRLLLAPPCVHRRGRTVGVYGNGTNSWHRKKLGRCIRVDEMRSGMGIDWMTRAELSQAIPPAYSEWIGREMMGRVVNAMQVHRLQDTLTENEL